MDEEPDGGPVILAVSIVSLGVTLIGGVLMSPLIISWSAPLMVRVITLYVMSTIIFSSAALVQFAILDRRNNKEK